MAANFWVSSHERLLLSAEEVAARTLHPKDAEAGLTAEDVRLLKLHATICMRTLAQHIKVRQRVLATAIVYMRRIYLRKAFSDYDIRLAGPTCLYLAGKTEEGMVQAKLVIICMKRLWPKLGYEVKDMLEMEMRLLEALEYYLVVFHPYRPLVQFLRDGDMMHELIQTTWSLVNDSYRTDMSVMYPPHLIALGSIFLACVLKEKDVGATFAMPWFESIRVDLNAIRNVALELLDFYEKIRGINEEHLTFNKLGSHRQNRM